MFILHQNTATRRAEQEWAREGHANLAACVKLDTAKCHDRESNCKRVNSLASGLLFRLLVTMWPLKLLATDLPTTRNNDVTFAVDAAKL